MSEALKTMANELTKTPVEEGNLEEQGAVENALFEALTARYHIKPLVRLNRDQKTFAKIVDGNEFIAFYVWGLDDPPFGGVPEGFYKVSGGGSTRQAALSDLLKNSLRITSDSPLKNMYRTVFDAQW